MTEANRYCDSQCRWNFATIAVNTIFSFVMLAIFAVATGVGCCLGALGGKTLELLGVQVAVHYGDILGDVAGFGYILHLCFRRPKPAHSRRTISEEEAGQRRRKHDGLDREH